jgi:hypothetical protein
LNSIVKLRSVSARFSSVRCSTVSIFHSRVLVIDERKKRFGGINDFVTDHGGWMVSIPGEVEMRFEAMPGSALPDELRKLGYIVVPTGTTERILPHAVAQPMTLSSSGALVAATEGSTKPVTLQVTNAGIATVEMFDLHVP